MSVFIHVNMYNGSSKQDEEIINNLINTNISMKLNYPESIIEILKNIKSDVLKHCKVLMSLNTLQTTKGNNGDIIRIRRSRMRRSNEDELHSLFILSGFDLTYYRFSFFIQIVD